MKLFHLVLWRISLALIVVLTVWAGFFYMAVVEEVNDEVDDTLEDYSEGLIIRALSGEDMPTASNGSNNQYYLYEVSESYAASHPQITYRDEMVFITEKSETEPARVLITIFRTEDERYMELVVYTPTIEKLDLLRAILGWIIFLYVLLLLIILSINIWVFRKNMKPLYVLLKWLDTSQLGKKNEPLENTTKITEFRKLNAATMAFAERGEKLFEQQKTFIGNASHEMQTPLAICRNRLEMLMEDETLTEHQLNELIKTHQTLENLTRMNRSLLLLCKIENGQFVDTRSVCLNDILAHYLDDYKEVYAYRNITVTVTTDSSFCVEMNDSLVSVLVTNLLKNSFVHNIDGGFIYIKITANTFEISNTGEKPLDRERIFERFYQGQKKEGSTGLGLALVDSICKANHLKIDYTYVENRHIFTISKQNSE
ncbi:sensor histidine kinase [Phocaeicola coprocola]|jgi:two-component system sensor histidine kinase QseC|uniref:histidine kinase n=2 Tax=Phocaeicola coprocola TaxID=310298 RepID=B3JPH4_9BACT|nr:HAMP domain-containing sensor histidine kinase [Phocaeicola coprocola]EDU99185.1 ATPase/histidine kinase/DNA gyrase B/HSP90 domain protein [Phocaeicola coprocola DSM 17136]MCC3346793.1 HAMP domain-containing histidine kinase [Phocaeicola coprocola DSM 17136]RGR88867.1 sensor histidine kinase [Phocaeicola coprocola]